MKSININEYLNNTNPWASRLLGLTDFKKNRNIDQIENEYNLDKYAGLLKHKLEDIEQYKTKEFELAGLHPTKSKMCVSFHDELFETNIGTARTIFYNLIKQKVTEYASENICELGCGYGYNLSYLPGNTYGGEYAKNAVTLAKQLQVNVREFNYYEKVDYEFIKPNTTVVTIHSVEQIPDATSIIDNLYSQKDKINYVVHFEPTVVKERTSLIGMLRNKYMEMNDYNRNLIELLKTDKRVEVLEISTDVFGLMPLNSSNVIVWKFKN